MGLDVVEIVLEIEDRFGIKIDDAEAEKVETVGQLHALVCQTLGRQLRGTCVTQPVFYQLRNLAAEWNNFDRRTFRPRAVTTDALPLRNRRQVWEQIARMSGVTLPPLQHRSWVRQGLGTLMVIAFFTGFVGLIGGIVWLIDGTSDVGFPLVLLSVAATAIVLHLLLDWVARPWRHEPPLGCQTVGDLTRFIARHTSAFGRGAWSSKAVFRELQLILAEELGVITEKITPDAHLVRDLGMA